MTDYKELTKKIHKHGLMMEDIILLGSACYIGRVNQAFSGLWDMYESQLVCHFNIPKEEIPGDASEFGEWLIDHGFDAFLCLISIPLHTGAWQEVFFYGESIESCVDQAWDWICKPQLCV